MRPLNSRDPKSIGGFTLINRLGAGGMGDVFLAERDGQSAEAIQPFSAIPQDLQTFGQEELGEEEVFFAEAQSATDVPSTKSLAATFTEPASWTLATRSLPTLSRTGGRLKSRGSSNSTHASPSDFRS